METKTYELVFLRFRVPGGSFPAHFHISRGERTLRFLFVSRWFPFVSRFPPYTQETRNEAADGSDEVVKVIRDQEPIMRHKIASEAKAMSGKYDPPNKKQLLADNPRIETTVELMVAAAEAQFPPKTKCKGEASCARETENPKSLPHAQAHAMDHPNLRRGRKPVVTREKVHMICALIAKGKTEKAACIRAGISGTAWNTAKRSDVDLRERIAAARDDWARLRHAQHAAALYESQSTRAAGRKVPKPRPTHQAKLVAWHLTFRVPLNFAAIPEDEIVSACERFNLPLETWRRQEGAFGLMQKVYAKRSNLRGQQSPPIPTLVMGEAPESQPNDVFGSMFGY